MTGLYVNIHSFISLTNIYASVGSRHFWGLGYSGKKVKQCPYPQGMEVNTERLTITTHVHIIIRHFLVQKTS